MGFWQRLFGGKPEVPADPPAPSPPPAPPPPPAPKPVEPEWPAILGKTYNHVKSKQLGHATPIADVRIQGVPCQAEHVVGFHRNGRLSNATLAATYEIGGEVFHRGAYVSFEADGTVRGWIQVLAAERAFTVRGAEADVTIAIPAGSKVAMEWGKLREVDLAGPVELDGLAIPDKATLVFGDSGALSHVTCREEVELRGIRWAARETVVFLFGKLHEGWPADAGTYDNVRYQHGEIVRLHDNGRLARCYLDGDQTLSGVPCREGTRVYLDDDGNLLEGTLAIDTTLAGVPVAEGEEVSLAGGKPVLMTPREDVVIGGVPCAKGALVEVDDGRLVRGTLSAAHAIDGWQLPAGSVVVILDGKLKRAIATNATAPDGRERSGSWRFDLAADGSIRHELPTTDVRRDTITLRDRATVIGLEAAAGSNVSLDDEGRVKSLVLATDQKVGGWMAKAGTRVHFHPTGEPSTFYLAATTTIDDVRCAGAHTLGSVMNGVEHDYREQVRLHPDGSVGFATLAVDSVIDDAPLKAGEMLSFYDTGELSSGTLAKNWTHPLGCVAAKGTAIGLFEDGSPRWITLAEPFTFGGVAYQVGTELRFKSPGVLESIAAHVPLGSCEPI